MTKRTPPGSLRPILFSLAVLALLVLAPTARADVHSAETEPTFIQVTLRKGTIGKIASFELCSTQNSECTPIGSPDGYSVSALRKERKKYEELVKDAQYYAAFTGGLGLMMGVEANLRAGVLSEPILRDREVKTDPTLYPDLDKFVGSLEKALMKVRPAPR